MMKKKNVLKSTILKKKIFFKKHDFDKQIGDEKSRYDSIYLVKSANFAFDVQF